MKKIKDYFNSKSWFHYWIAHILVALLISAFFLIVGYFTLTGDELLSFAGAVFYLGRELGQLEKFHDFGQVDVKFDWMGFIMPLFACFILFFILYIC